ncbi:DUF6504 family protein [Ornithinimicrobium avium]|uniref:DUF6504 domain-containing protein n=1 Tax=Ornithinimicrobium avium TaxID=2283195 RepID=A0A345NKM1_9MICO|nr:DUF6504 family protein [Ornithinimicrobium avium]AXH95579.1 hypothetical protein DV701_05095 [Ornithinimicrobium avium]
MSRRYQDPVEVRVGDPVEHRVRLEPGWCRGAEPAGGATDVPTTFLWRGRVHLVRGVLARWTQRVPWWRQEDPPSRTGPRLEQEVWRVEATAGRAHGSGVYDLVHGEEWLLERVSD